LLFLRGEGATYLHEAMNKEENELAAFATHWDEAMEGNVVAEIGRYMADNWLIVGGNGITHRSEFLEHIASGELVHDRMEADEMHVRILGDTGTVIARGISAGYYKGEHFNLHEWSTSVFMRTQGQWKCVLTMLAPVEGAAE
jgi:ketosteroid isomerase-like protein